MMLASRLLRAVRKGRVGEASSVAAQGRPCCFFSNPFSSASLDKWHCCERPPLHRLCQESHNPVPSLASTNQPPSLSHVHPPSYDHAPLMAAPFLCDHIVLDKELLVLQDMKEFLSCLHPSYGILDSKIFDARGSVGFDASPILVPGILGVEDIIMEADSVKRKRKKKMNKHKHRKLRRRVRRSGR